MHHYYSHQFSKPPITNILWRYEPREYDRESFIPNSLSNRKHFAMSRLLTTLSEGSIHTQGAIYITKKRIDPINIGHNQRFLFLSRHTVLLKLLGLRWNSHLDTNSRGILGFSTHEKTLIVSSWERIVKLNISIVWI